VTDPELKYPGGSPVIPPKQARSQETLNRIWRAALDLMEERGIEGTTVAAIVERAGASVGSFYARFAGKEELVRFLQERVWTEARERWDAALGAQDWASLSISSVLEGVVGLLIQSYRADFQRRRALGRGQEGEGRSGYFTAFHEHLLSTVSPLLLVREQEISHPEPAQGIRYGYRFTIGGIREMLDLRGFGGTSEVALEDEVLVRELARAWTGYLCPEALTDEGQPTEEVDFFDPWG
jgi:AcrR family transcriptional regulator